ncbi:hypothetical protein JCGZ_08805 [Jatropha curcas]|uniref:Uncharacterized protein n=1 Tax=Jatropha curcas TaxID=180498 RepID=A0A067KIV6_JATCU|nr:hypothetical protein JCGZ_08805 [Jatropha curcas]
MNTNVTSGPAMVALLERKWCEEASLTVAVGLPLIPLESGDSSHQEELRSILHAVVSNST